MAQSLISIIIPTNNEAHDGRLLTTIKSMCSQSYRNLEILVVDDHSTDNTREIVQKVAVNDSRVKYHLLPSCDTKRKHRLPTITNGKLRLRDYDVNGGYIARNYGFTIAQGDYIALQDADDASLANRIEAQYNLLKKYDATLVAIQWMQLKNEYIPKKLDIEKIFREIGEDNIIIRPETIAAMAKKNKGILMNPRFPHQYIPFICKWFPLTRPFFFAGIDNYPGADNSMLFKREVVDKVKFRPYNERVWPNPYGRGSGRDFAFQVAETFKNSWSFKLPLYLWRATSPNKDFYGYEKYFV